MGLCESSESKAQAAESARIDRELAKSAQQAEKTVKLLLLGSRRTQLYFISNQSMYLSAKSVMLILVHRRR